MNGVVRIVIACLSSGIVLSGCSDSKAREGTGAFSTDAPRSFATSDQVLSQRELDAAVAAMPEASDFSYVLDHDVLAPLLSTEGTVHAGEGWAAVTTVADPVTGEDYTIRSVSRVTEQWMQMDEWTDAQSGCWLPMTATQVPVGIQALRAERPVPYLLLDEITATGDGYTAPFGLAAQLFTVQATESLGWNDLLRSTTSIPVDIVATDGVVTSMRVEATDLLNVEPAPKKAPPAQVAIIRGIDVLITFDEGQSYDDAPPEPSTIIRPGEQDCGGRSS